MDSVNSLEHDLIAFDLSGAVQIADISSCVVGLGEVGIAEGVGHTVVEPLDGFIRPLTQVLKADASVFAVYFGA